jgi:hypothetical protein
LNSLEGKWLPIISQFFGIIVRMYYDEHNPPHIHVEYQGNKALFDFAGNIMRGTLDSKTATRLIREWIDLHGSELEQDWSLAKGGEQIVPILPLV